MSPFDIYLPALNAKMKSIVQARYLGQKAPSLVYELIEYHLGWRDERLQPAQVNSGKHLRPVLLLLCCEAFGGQWQAALNAAVAVEMLHNFTLIHDDIEDRDELRRGRATLWTLCGVPQAINAGDALFALSYDALLASDTTSVSADTLLAISQRFTETIMHLTEGQCEDMAFESVAEVSEARYLAMIGGKTAALLGLCCEIGARVAQVSENDCQLANQFGILLGYAFQMQDDVLGIWGDPAQTGKPAGSDLIKQKKTLPIVHGLEHTAELANLLKQESLSSKDLATAMHLLEQAGSNTYTQAKAGEYLNRAQAALHSSSASGPALHAIDVIVNKLVCREK